ncbi:hypothetical protein NA56DRAFT_747867 [Hyaloscypha hepaticicola]|uniref:Uncharacterized protein n=1 Tax=Hyaloscypha hepaticicola TaxID=2082293 RepID=A0A2J6Q8Q3_9HELO|nr:hypothetical protein NA56DRAFT_747867 [Hyaloscypha hepaticicola]
MVQLKSLTFIILAAAGIVSALPSPAAETKGTLAGPAEDLPHGIYTVDLADDGSTTWTFIAPINETLKATTVAARDLEGLDKRDGVSCNGFGTPADDVNVAQGNLANQCGGGYFFSGRSIAAYYGTGVAFGCNYGNGQTCHSDQLWSDFGAINSQCGFTSGAQAGAGWYSHNSWKATYGRTAAASGFC